MKRWITLLLCTLLAACGTTPRIPPPAAAALLHDDAFTPPPGLITADELFRLDGAMRGRLAQLPPHTALSADLRAQLIDLLYRKHTLMLSYDASTTRTAAQTFRAGAGNCLSLVIMTAAFAKALDLPVEYRSVDVQETWTRSGDLLLASGHVNLALEWPLMGRLEGGGARVDLRAPIVIDFVPATELRGVPARHIGEATVVAMFMNNRAAEALVRGGLDEAYAYAREAVRQDPGFLAAYNTLGVIYLRQRQPAWAQAAFAAVLEREPANTKVMANQVQALRDNGEPDAAALLARRLALLDPEPPYHFFQAGLAAMRRHDYRAALGLLRQEQARQVDNPEVHFWLAQAQYGLGNLREAAREMELAKDNSITLQDHAIYAAKLAWLRQHHQTE